MDQKIFSHRSKQPAPLAGLRPDVPAALTAIFEKMTAKDPKRRYQKPADVVQALGPWC